MGGPPLRLLQIRIYHLPHYGVPQQAFVIVYALLCSEQAGHVYVEVKNHLKIVRKEVPILKVFPNSLIQCICAVKILKFC